MRSDEHRNSLRIMSLLYWLPVIIINFFANFGFPEIKLVGIYVICLTTLIALGVSFKCSKMSFMSWYHEIVMCGTDKISMSITSLSNPDNSRSFWMAPFEAYFGILIKFVNPAGIMFLMCENLAQDLDTPYGITEGNRMRMFSSIFVFIAGLIIVVPMFICTWPEFFEHNVEREFSADDIYEKAIKEANKKKK